MWRVLCLVCLMVLPVGASAFGAQKQEVVVLLHGILRSKSSMDAMGEFLQKQGYETINLGYPSAAHDITELADGKLDDALKDVKNDPDKTVHFVTHSMGGIVVRTYLASHTLTNLGRVVMLAPPNQGSQVADFLKDGLWYQWMYGPSGQELGTGKKGFISQLGAVHFELGVIAGSMSINPVTSGLLLPGNDDGTVTVKDTKVDGMKDHIVIPAMHSFIMWDGEAQRQTAYFLEHGEFDH